MACVAATDLPSALPDFKRLCPRNGMTSTEVTYSAELPSLAELGLLSQQQMWKSWFPSLPEFGRRPADCDRSASRESSPARKRTARSRERESQKDSGSFASGPLPFPISLRNHKAQPLLPKDDGLAQRSQSAPIITRNSTEDGRTNRRHTNAETHPDRDTKTGDDMFADGHENKENDELDGCAVPDDSGDDDDACISLPRPRTPPPSLLPLLDTKAFLEHQYVEQQDGEQTLTEEDWGSALGGRSEESGVESDLQSSMFPLQLPLMRRRSKRKRDVSPAMSLAGIVPRESRESRELRESRERERELRLQNEKSLPDLPEHDPDCEQCHIGDTEECRSENNTMVSQAAREQRREELAAEARLTLRRPARIAPLPPGMRAGETSTGSSTGMPYHGEVYVLYKFDRVDELGGRRRGSRR